MKERPILFSAPMVRAILDGRKTQTRRVVKHDLRRLGDGDWYAFDHKGINYRVNSRHTTVAAWANLLQFCPYGQPSDRLWVRETWQGPLLESDEQIDEFRQSPDIYKKSGFCAYRATDTLDAIDQDGKELGWRPSIHMPRWASRILLEITGVRVERLKDIGAADAIAEGIHHDDTIPFNGPWYASPTDSQGCGEPAHAYANLWESINGPGSWDANPWVWVIEFKPLKGGEA